MLAPYAKLCSIIFQKADASCIKFKVTLPVSNGEKCDHKQSIQILTVLLAEDFWDVFSSAKVFLLNHYIKRTYIYYMYHTYTTCTIHILYVLNSSFSRIDFSLSISPMKYQNLPYNGGTDSYVIPKETCVNLR